MRAGVHVVAANCNGSIAAALPPKCAHYLLWERSAVYFLSACLQFAGVSRNTLVCHVTRHTGTFSIRHQTVVRNLTTVPSTQTLTFKRRIKSRLPLLGAHHILHVSRIRVKLRLFSKPQKNIMKYK